LYTVMNLGSPWKTGNFLTERTAIFTKTHLNRICRPIFTSQVASQTYGRRNVRDLGFGSQDERKYFSVLYIVLLAQGLRLAKSCYSNIVPRVFVSYLIFWSLNSYKYLRIQYLAQRKHFTITKIVWLMLFKEIIALCTVNHTNLINTKCGFTDC
jgi:hypothetical protein